MSCDPHQGELFVFNANPWQKLTAFKVGEGSRALIIIGGQGDGFFGLNYTEQLTKAVVEQGWCVVQALFSSWYAGFRSATLENDNEDLDCLIHALVTKRGVSEIVLLGHHTGAQDVLFYMQTGQYRGSVTHVIFQGGMKNPLDNAANADDPTAKRLAEEAEQRARDAAQAMINEGRGNQLMPAELHPRPISAFRFLACNGMQGVSDFFSFDLPEEEMASVVGHIDVPTLVVFCCTDDFRPTYTAKSELFDTIQTCIPADVTAKWMPGACDEHFNFLTGMEEQMTSFVVNFLFEEDNKKNEREEEQRREQEAEAKKKRSIVYQKHGLRRSISQSSIASSAVSLASA